MLIFYESLFILLSTGFDHIDLKECKKRKIIVCNIPHYGENTVAEHTFALILNFLIVKTFYERMQFENGFARPHSVNTAKCYNHPS